MKTVNKIVSGAVIGIGLTMGLMSSTAHAFFCPIVYDVVRTSYFAIQTGGRLDSVIAEQEAISSKKEELKIWETRKRFKEDKKKGKGGEAGEDGDAEKFFPEAVYYEYMKNAAATGSEEYLQAQADAARQADYVRKNFFYDSDISKLTEEDKQKVINRRLSYIDALAKETLSLSAGARENIAAELNILKDVKTTAGGTIQQIDMLVQTKKVMVEQKAADILLQAKLLELEAAQLMLGLNPQRVEKPDEEGGKDDE